MDELTRRLRDDAALIKADISPELDDRIRASLEGVVPEQPQKVRPVRTRSLWWASSLTGVAAAVAVIVVVNLFGNDPAPAPETVAGGQTIEVPRLDLRVETAVLTGPLTEEMEALQADLEKAEKVLREDFPLGL